MRSRRGRRRKTNGTGRVVHVGSTSSSTMIIVVLTQFRRQRMTFGGGATGRRCRGRRCRIRSRTTTGIVRRLHRRTTVPLLSISLSLSVYIYIYIYIYIYVIVYYRE